MTRAVVLLLLVSGCISKRDGAISRAAPYYGPTLPMADVVDRINANNSRLPTLRASIPDFEVIYFDEQKRRHEEIFSGTLLYRAPRDVLVTGSKGPATRVLEIGSNQDIYWVVARKPGPDTAWWGRYKHLGKPCAEPIPIRPDLVVEVLGLSMINPDFNQPPVPVMRFNHGADAYMFIWNRRSDSSDRWLAVKEVWYDRATLRPRAVVLFDDHGRVVMEAMLSRHVQVEVPQLTRADWPTVASEFRLFFPDSGARLLLRLSNAVVRYRGLPNDKTFVFNPQAAGGVSKVIQLDEACGP